MGRHETENWCLETDGDPREPGSRCFKFSRDAPKEWKLVRKDKKTRQAEVKGEAVADLQTSQVPHQSSQKVLEELETGQTATDTFNGGCEHVEAEEGVHNQ